MSEEIATERNEIIEDVLARYPNEWFLFDVREWDQFGHPYKGILLAHHPDRSVIYSLVLTVKAEHLAIENTVIRPEDMVVLL